MSKKKGEGLKSFNRGFNVPDTYIIIFFVVVIAAVMTFLVPKGYYETEDVTYLMNGVEKTRTVIKDGSFQYLTDAAGKPVTEGVALFSGDGGTGFFNYMYNGIISSSAIEIIAFLMVVGGAFGIMIRTGAVEAGLIGLIRKAKGAEKLLIPVLFVLFSLGGVLSGKAGVINVHLGNGARCMELIERVISETEIPASQFLPTHVNRNEKLFQKAIEYAVKGGAVDFTGNEEIDYWETVCDEVRVCKGIRRMLDAGVNPKHITISSDGQGSLPIFNEKGEFLRMGMGQSSCLLKEVKECVEKAGIPLETAISTITANPAEILSLKGKGKIREGYDADLCVLDQGLEIQEVVARGKTVYRK